MSSRQGGNIFGFPMELEERSPISSVFFIYEILLVIFSISVKNFDPYTDREPYRNFSLVNRLWAEVMQSELLDQICLTSPGMSLYYFKHVPVNIMHDQVGYKLSNCLRLYYISIEDMGLLFGMAADSKSLQMVTKRLFEEGSTPELKDKLMVGVIESFRRNKLADQEPDDVLGNFTEYYRGTGFCRQVWKFFSRSSSCPMDLRNSDGIFEAFQYFMNHGSIALSPLALAKVALIEDTGNSFYSSFIHRHIIGLLRRRSQSHEAELFCRDLENLDSVTLRSGIPLGIFCLAAPLIYAALGDNGELTNFMHRSKYDIEGTLRRMKSVEEPSDYLLDFIEIISVLVRVHNGDPTLNASDICTYPTVKFASVFTDIMSEWPFNQVVFRLAVLNAISEIDDLELAGILTGWLKRVELVFLWR